MSVDLIVLGIFQGFSWSSLMPWELSTGYLDPVLGVPDRRRVAHVRGLSCVRRSTSCKPT